MDVATLPDALAEDVAARLYAAPAELLLEALPPLERGARLLELDVGRGALSLPLDDRMARAGGELVVVAAADLGRYEGARAGFVRAERARLPFAAASFTVVAGNLVLGSRADDAPLVRALARVLTPDGTAVMTALLAGSFDEAFDVLTEVSEQDDLPRLRAAVTDARRELYEEDELEQLLDEAGFTVDVWGEEERALWYDDGKEATGDPLLWDALLRSWIGEPPPSLRGQCARFIDSYFGGERFPLRVRTGVIRARRTG